MITIFKKNKVHDGKNEGFYTIFLLNYYKTEKI